MATGTQMFVTAMLEYFKVLSDAAWFAADPASIEVSPTWERAKVSATVTSHASAVPLAHGMSVAPSGLLPSARMRPTGSLTAGICALLTTLHMMSFKCACLICLAALFRQDRPWSPLASTSLPPGHVCGSQTLAPSLVAIYIRTISSLSRSPTAVISGTCNQSPECSAQAESIIIIIITIIINIIIIIFIYLFLFFIYLFILFIFFSARQHKACRLRN